jgi:hypothetical protein
MLRKLQQYRTQTSGNYSVSERRTAEASADLDYRNYYSEHSDKLLVNTGF